MILEYDGTFLFPEYIFEEFRKHEEELLKKSRMSKKDFENLVGLLLRKVRIVRTGSLLKHREGAMRFVKDIDPDDVLFIACVLAFPNSVLWSDDKRLKNTNLQVLNTQEMGQALDTQET